MQAVHLAFGAAIVAGASLCTGAAVAQQGGHVGPSASEYQAMGAPAGPNRSRLPSVRSSVLERSLRTPGVAPLGVPSIAPTSSDGVRLYQHRSASQIEPQAYATAKLPYTTKRAAVGVLGAGTTAAQVPITSFPFRATGKMVVTFGADDFDCTAALIRKGVLLTAAHCIHNYGTGAAGYADAIQWTPAEYSSAAGGPYGVWRGRYWTVPSFYQTGKDTCDKEAIGVACNNDIALVVLHQNTIGGKLTWPGTLLGYYAWAANGYSYVTSPALGNKRAAQITQLGYPSAFDASYQMQRTDAVGFRATLTGTATSNGKLFQTTVIGTAQTGGSSGGPWFANFGVTPAIDTSVATHGSSYNQAIVGVTSYGTDFANDAGSSWLGQNAEYPNAAYGTWGAGNVGFLLNFVCSQTAYKPACAN